jgi:phosphoribosylformylglycinamidine synthase
LVTVATDNTQAFEALFAGQSCACIGEVVTDTILNVTGAEGEPLLNAKLDDLKQAWQAPLREL